jgi:hypothetical protein
MSISRPPALAAAEDTEPACHHKIEPRDMRTAYHKR